MGGQFDVADPLGAGVLGGQFEAGHVVGPLDAVYRGIAADHPGSAARERLIFPAEPVQKLDRRIRLGVETEMGLGRGGPKGMHGGAPGQHQHQGKYQPCHGGR